MVWLGLGWVEDRSFWLFLFLDAALKASRATSHPVVCEREVMEGVITDGCVGGMTGRGSSINAALCTLLFLCNARREIRLAAHATLKPYNRRYHLYHVPGKIKRPVAGWGTRGVTCVGGFCQ